MTRARPERSRRIAAFAAALALAALAGGCATRARDNPLDPRNRVTHGMLVGFQALAGDGVVQLRWPLLTQQGVEGYHVERWRPGGTPLLLPGAVFPSYVGSAEDSDVLNDSVYVYRLVATFTTGDSAVSPADTAAPGPLRIVALTAEPAGFSALTADARELLYSIASKVAYTDMVLDPERGWFWLSQYDLGTIERRRFNGTTVGQEIDVTGPADLSVGAQKGIVWATRPYAAAVVSYLADTTAVIPGNTIFLTGLRPTAVEADALSGTVWVGTAEGWVDHAAATGSVVDSWRLPGGVGAIAVDAAVGGAWVAVHDADLFDLYYLVAGDPDPGAPLRTGLLNVVDLEVDPLTRSLWISEQGVVNAGQGRLTRVNLQGQTQSTLTGIEPYGITVEPRSGDCWVADLASNALLEVSPAGVIVRRSHVLGVPYRVAVYRP
ncbi:MAG TPA: hypothetical protein VF363_09620 [Candidatus Eisenbacteria bacterium]